MAHDGKTQRETVRRAAEPELAAPAGAAASETPRPSSYAASGLGSHKPGGKENGEALGRRPAKRRPAGPARPKIAANDDAPSIGGLIYSLQQKPTNRPFQLAAMASGVWLVVCGLLAWATQASGVPVLSGPMLAVLVAAMCLPIALLWFLAMLAWRTQELKLMSSAMTEVAVRLAEPDRAAEQSAASLGQAVRRQVSFMNEAISRALGRAGELEALVHNEVAALEKSYNENEHKIKGLIQELVGERHALVSTTDKVAETLKSMGAEVPSLIDKLSQQQIKLAKIIEGAGQNLIALENQLAAASGGLENALANRTQQLQAVLDDYTVALDATLANRAEALDMQLVERTRALDAAFSERLALFDDSMLRTARAIDNAVNEKARALTAAMENHVLALSDTFGRQMANLDRSMIAGMEEVRRTSDSVTRQSLKAIEGLNSQADVLKGMSHSMLHQTPSAPARSSPHLEHAQSQVEFERMRAEADAQTRRVIEDMRSAAGRFREAVDSPRHHPAVDSADTMRTTLNDQLRALEQLSTLAPRDRHGAPAAHGVPPHAAAPSLAASYAAQAGGVPPQSAPGSADAGERWSLGDLLARASEDGDGLHRGAGLDIEGIARALDPTTASAIWSRFRAGQRGIMVRSIYTAEGRASFDEVSDRYGKDMDFRRTVDRFLADFERMVRDTEQKSPRAVHDHLVSDAGRVYLFLAHATGRLR